MSRFIFGLIFWFIILGTIMYGVKGCNQQLEKEGLKGIVEDIWYGQDSTEVQNELYRQRN